VVNAQNVATVVVNAASAAIAHPVLSAPKDRTLKAARLIAKTTSMPTAI
jgi:hypothetical protein